MSHPDDLKSIGLKATLPRLKILDLFEHSNKRHMTAEEVLFAAQRKKAMTSASPRSTGC